MAANSLRENSWSQTPALSLLETALQEVDANGEWLKPYSFRDTFSVRSHGKRIPTELICEAMGHSPEVHNRGYRTTEWEAVQEAYGEAG